MVARTNRRQLIDSSDEESVSLRSNERTSWASEWGSDDEDVEVVSDTIQAKTTRDELARELEGLRVDPSSNPMHDLVSETSTSLSSSSISTRSESSASSSSSASLPERHVDSLNKSYAKKKTLMPHQRVGVEWLLNLYKVPSGGILADDMGLGKTFQVASFIHTLMERGHAKRILIVAPKTLLGAWENEVSKELEMTLTIYGGTHRATTKRERQAIIENIARRGGILMMTYGLIQRDADIVRTHELHDEDEGPFWDVMIMDEGHTLKNTGNKTREEIEKVAARMKLLITGTPIQNNLMELHSLFDLVKEGLLGNRVEFKDTFEKPIKRGMRKEASRRSQDMGTMARMSLQKTYEPFMLRRTKEDVMGMGGGDAPGGGSAAQASWRKKDIVVWLRLTDTQLGLYKAFLRSKSVREVLNRNRSALASLTVLKKICKHPALLSDDLPDGLDGSLNGVSLSDGIGGVTDAFGNSGKSNNESTTYEQRQELKELRESAEWKLSQESCGDKRGDVVAASCKTLFVLGLLDKLVSTNHRALVFSESKVMLSILEDAIAERRWKYLRIDGDVDGAERHARVTRFQEDNSFPVFLLTSQVGGLGLTLTAADRVILCDPSWNPSVDNQSVDRACRLGQTRDVLVYRLVSCGTIEDKVYQKQVFKGAIFKAGTEQGEQQRYFSESETQVVIMEDLFTSAPEEFYHSSTQKQLEARHRHQRNIPPEMQREIDSLSSIESFVGFSDHDLLYNEVRAVSDTIVDQVKVFRPSTTPQGKTSGPMYQGDDQLAAMFDKALSLGAPSVPAAVSKEQAENEARMQLQADLQKQEKLLSNRSLIASLPDGGAKVRETVAKLKQQLREMAGGQSKQHDCDADQTTPASRRHENTTDQSQTPIHSSTEPTNPDPPADLSKPTHPTTPSTDKTRAAPDLLEVVQRQVSEPTPLPKGHQNGSNAPLARTTSIQEQGLVLRAKMKRAKAALHRKAKELEAYRLGTHVKLEEDAKLKSEVEQLLGEFIRAKSDWERGA